MKTMTCKQLGGPCDQAFSAVKADDVIKAQDRHLVAAVEVGDTAHAAALQQMQSRWKRPVAAMGWYRTTKRTFAALADD